ncbi:MAG: D-alanine-D-alanine ligase [Chloroflexota bacterium]|nr:D-alanine-D-alanine ligase [Chloroflexota bacterium]
MKPLPAGGVYYNTQAMHIALIYDPSPSQTENSSSQVIQAYHEDVNQAIAGALRAQGHTVNLLAARADLETQLQTLKPDFAFNCSIKGHAEGEKAFTPAVLKKLGIPFTGSGGPACFNAYNKARTKRILKEAHISTPQALLVRDPAHYSLPASLTYPLFVKPVRGGCSFGIGPQNLIADADSLRQRLPKLFNQAESPLLVEEFLEGREFTAGVLGNREARVLPIMEFRYGQRDGARYRSYSLKMVNYQDEELRCPAELKAEKRAEVKKLVQRTFKALGCRDYARVDVRMDRQNKPYVLEVNALPNLMPKTSSYAIMAQKAGLNFRTLIDTILHTAAERYTHA